MARNPLYEPIIIVLGYIFYILKYGLRFHNTSHSNIIFNPFRIKQNVIMTFSACIYKPRRSDYNLILLHLSV